MSRLNILYLPVCVALHLSGPLAIVQCLVLHPKCDAVCLKELTGLTQRLYGLREGHRYRQRQVRSCIAIHTSKQ